MLGGADNPNGELPSYITGADSSDIPAVCFPGIPPLDSSATGRWSAAQRWRTVAGRCDGRGVYRCISAR
ncbi:hypothetical protein D4638_25875 [Escherichia coli]|nr:hypothetical protein [Escherichia coli]EEX0338641.1 hypothetical protein [Escherichia coli]EEX0384708.1 hypothetical protein [Escherichia coli]